MKNKIKSFSFFKGIREYTQNHPFVKFLVVLFLFLVYLFFTMINFGISNGLIVTLLTWTFFVFGTPIADAGVLIDFPLRLITGIRMIYSEIMVWTIAFFTNLFTFFLNPSIYDTTLLLKLFKYILSHPYPYWIIILLSALGTFLSIYFGDEILDILSLRKRKRKIYEEHINKYKLIVFLFIIAFIILVYYFLLNHLNLKIPLF